MNADHEAMNVDRHGFEVLDREECLRLLARGGLGRIGLTSGALPMILPVDFALDGDAIVIRTGPGTRLAAATTGTVVAFEADHVDVADDLSWSVLVTGRAEPIIDGTELDRLRHLPLRQWGAGEPHFVRISTDIMSGRRGPATGEPQDQVALAGTRHSTRVPPPSAGATEQRPPRRSARSAMLRKP